MVISQILGWGLLTATIVSLILIYWYVFKSKEYVNDIFGLIMDSWDVVGLAIVLILVSLVLIFKI